MESMKKFAEAKNYTIGIGCRGGGMRRRGSSMEHSQTKWKIPAFAYQALLITAIVW